MASHTTRATSGAKNSLSPRSGARILTCASPRLTPWASVFRPPGFGNVQTPGACLPACLFRVCPRREAVLEACPTHAWARETRSIPLQQRYSNSRIILCSRSSEHQPQRPRWARSKAKIASASCAREQTGRRADSRTQHPRNSAMNCISSLERPARKRRDLDCSERFAHETRAATSVSRTPRLLWRRTTKPASAACRYYCEIGYPAQGGSAAGFVGVDRLGLPSNAGEPRSSTA